MADFNGVTLPDLPEVDTSVYPYAQMANVNEGAYSLNYFTKPLVYNPTTGMLEMKAPFKMLVYMGNSGMDTWEYYGESEVPEGEDLETPIENYVMHWINYDVVNKETGEVVIPSSVKPLFYYNGVRLPQLPQDVLAEYPNCYILHQVVEAYDTDGIFLTFTKTKIYKSVVNSNDALIYVSDTKEKIYQYNTEMNTWDFMQESTMNAGASYLIGVVASADLTYTSTLLWTNTDIPNGSADATEIYLKGTQAYSEDTQVSITIKSLCDIGDAIRDKVGNKSTINPKNMPSEIEGISGGGDLNAFLNGDIEELTSDIEIISAYCCYSKDELISVNFPNATRIQINAFNNCTKLKNVNIPNAINALDNSFTKCSSLESLVLPKVTSIGYSAFTYCEKLKYIDLPSAKSIGNYAFNNCYSLKAVVLRANTLCTSSMGGVFNSCYHILGTAYPTHNPNGDKDGYIYVPRALVDTYKTATNWTTYASQFRALEDYTVDGTTTGELDESKI